MFQKPHNSSQDSILKALNDIQKKAVLHENGPMVVFAGAGSGKTRIITARIAYLIAGGVHPSQILAVTFTNKAAREMKERVESLNSNGFGVHIGTFHSACARWLREFAPKLGFQSDFSIYDDKDALNALKLILKELNVKLEDTSANEYKAAIAKAKVLGWLPSEAEKLAGQYVSFFPDLGIQVYRRYQEYLAMCNAMDFSDLLMNMLLLLRRDKQVRAILQKRYRYILVDEYQDTNPTQFSLISCLVNNEQNLCVVGDDDQSIYSWRGADPANILEFRRHYPGAKEIRLEQNYRCTKNIIAAASAVISKNTVRAEKTLWTENDPGESIDYHIAYDGEMESSAVVDSIHREKSIYPYHDVAIFYRTNAQSRQIEDSLLKQNIPYRIYGALRFYDRAEIKDLLAYLRIIVNEQDDLAFHRIINIPARGIGKKALENIQERAREEGISNLHAAIKMADEQIPRLSNKLKAFKLEFANIKEKILASSLSDVLATLLGLIDYKTYLEKKFPEQVSDKMANIHELGAALADYSESSPNAKLSEWLKDVSLSGSEKEANGGVCLMTLHSAKGLEFSRVYILGLEDGLLPHASAQDDLDELEEERRLFYVGITRARKKLSLHSARKRRIFNQWMANEESRFLKEIPSNLLTSKSSISTNRSLNGGNYGTMPTPAGMQAGAYVSHPTFGRGIIASVEGGSIPPKAIVEFKEFGKRKIALHHLKQVSSLS